MSSSGFKGIAIACFVICAILLFVAWERYQTNAEKVRAMNQVTQSSPLRQMMGGEMEPATPAATKYALVFAALSAGGGVVCLVMAGKQAGPGR